MVYIILVMVSILIICIAICIVGLSLKDLKASLHFFNLRDDHKLNSIIYYKLLEICKREKIDYKDVPQLLLNWNEPDSNEWAAGTYSFYYNDNKKVIPVCIKINSTYLRDESSKLFTLAHELGHHFAITELDDRSEEMANKYIDIIFRRYFPSYIRAIFQTPIEVRANIEINIDMVKEFKKFKKCFKSDFSY